MRRFILTLTFAFAQFAQAAPAAQPSGYFLQGLPLVRQTYNSCGPASLAAVLAYYHLNVTQAEVSAHTRVNSRAYMSAQAIVEYVPRFGLKARLFAGGTVNTVRQAVANGLPLIVLQDVQTTNGKVVPHWRVPVGFDDRTQMMYFNDPLLGYAMMTYTDFTTVWQAHRGQFAVIYPPQWETLVRQVLG